MHALQLPRTKDRRGNEATKERPERRAKKAAQR